VTLIDELSQRIATELHHTLEQGIRQAIEKYFVGDVKAINGAGSNGHGPRRSQPAMDQETRRRAIMEAVQKFGEASVDDVARVTGLDKRGVGSSLHYLAAAGKLKHAGARKYKPAHA
jgi:hypothetical protein